MIHHASIFRDNITELTKDFSFRNEDVFDDAKKLNEAYFKNICNDCIRRNAESLMTTLEENIRILEQMKDIIELTYDELDKAREQGYDNVVRYER